MENIATVNCDLAHTAGNVTFILTEFVKNLFEKGFWKHVHVTTRMPYKEFMQDEDKITNGFIRKNKPILIIRPVVDINNDDVFMSRTLLTRDITGRGYPGYAGNYMPLFRDNQADITISYLIHRIRVQCQCVMMFDTARQQMNVFSYLLGLYNAEQVQWMNVALEEHFPMYLIQKISELSGKDVRNPETGMVKDFLNYLIAHSKYYFTYKEKSASAREEFFVYYPITMEYVFTDFSMDDLQKRNDVSSSANISFTLTAEFNTMNKFQLSTERDDVGLKANIITDIGTETGVNIVPYFTVNNLFSEVDKNGYKMMYTNMFEISPDVPRNEPDILDLSGLFKDTALKDILEYHAKHGIPNDILFNFIVMKNSEVLNPDKSKGKIDYVVDLKNQRILIYNKTHGATYRLIIYINNHYIVSLMNRVGDIESTYEKSKGKETEKPIA